MQSEVGENGPMVLYMEKGTVESSLEGKEGSNS